MSALCLSGISKTFFGVEVLRDVSLDLGVGRVLGLVGQNGAGKSTLMNIVGGNLQPDAGRMQIDGRVYAPASARDAEAAGIAFIHQELNLFSNLSIAENVFIRAMPQSRAGLIDRRQLHERTARLLTSVALDLDPGSLVERLSPGERQLVEVVKALELDANIVIFDEPTSSLTPRETVRLFDLIGRMKAAGKAIVYISHILADIEALADDVAILRDGRLVATGPSREFPAARMINQMLGREVEGIYLPHAGTATAEELLEARGLSLPGVVHDVSFALHRGEILGVFGLMGSGRTELVRLLFGLEPFASGELWMGGRAVTAMTPKRAIAEGMAFITENRREEGLMMNATIADNIALAALGAFAGRLGLVDDEALTIEARRFAEALAIRSGPIDRQPARNLSGGNQQKVVIARWLMSRPRIFLLDEPTRGIDVGAKREIHQIILDLAAGGAGTILISSEIEEAMALADRILVMRQGEIVGAFAREDFQKEAILRAAFGEEGGAA